MNSKIKYYVISVLFMLLAMNVSSDTSTPFENCPEGTSPPVIFVVKFGLGHPDSIEKVSEDEWQEFLAQVIAPRFPTELTDILSTGLYTDSESGFEVIYDYKELFVQVPPDEEFESIIFTVREIVNTYARRFPNKHVSSFSYLDLCDDS